MVLYTIPNSTLNRFTLEFLVLPEVVERLSDRWDPKKSSSFHVLIPRYRTAHILLFFNRRLFEGRAPKRQRMAAAQKCKQPATDDKTDDDLVHSSDRSSCHAFSRRSFLQIIMRSLEGMGYSETAKTLEQESGVVLMSPTAAAFSEAVGER